MTDYRREDIDVLKGIAVVGVFLYHFGICRSGYLGVDGFLVRAFSVWRFPEKPSRAAVAVDHSGYSGIVVNRLFRDDAGRLSESG